MIVAGKYTEGDNNILFFGSEDKRVKWLISGDEFDIRLERREAIRLIRMCYKDDESFCDGLNSMEDDVTYYFMITKAGEVHLEGDKGTWFILTGTEAEIFTTEFRKKMAKRLRQMAKVYRILKKI